MITTLQGKTKPVEDMTREELLDHSTRGRAEDLKASCEMIRRHRRRMGERFQGDAPNVVPFPRLKRTPGHGTGGAA